MQQAALAGYPSAGSGPCRGPRAQTDETPERSPSKQVPVRGEEGDVKTYCTQNNGKCSTCSLVNYGLDCANNPIPTRPIPQTRYTRMMAAYKGFAGSRTVKAVLDQIPQDLQCHLTGRELGMVMTAVNAAYHNGKAKAEAEECIWYEGGVTVDEGGQERSGVLVPKAILAHMRIEHTITLAPRDPAQVKALGGPDAYHNYKTTYHLEES